MQCSICRRQRHEILPNVHLAGASYKQLGPRADKPIPVHQCCSLLLNKAKQRHHTIPGFMSFAYTSVLDWFTLLWVCSEADTMQYRLFCREVCCILCRLPSPAWGKICHLQRQINPQILEQHSSFFRLEVSS